MPQFKNTSDLLAYVRQAVDKSLTTEVFPVVRDAEVQTIDEVVYSYAASGYYRRREASGGLGSPSNIVISGGGAKNGVLAVENITMPNPYLDGQSADYGMATVDKNLSSVIEEGYGYDYWEKPKARPFTKKTIEKLNSSDACKNALKQGLIKQGIAVR